MNIPTQETEQPKPLLFGLGKLYVTAGIQEMIEKYALDVTPLIARHVSGDWGDVCEDDAAENRLSLKQGFRLLSAYRVTRPDQPDCTLKIWIITEADRSATTVLLPEEY